MKNSGFAQRGLLWVAALCAFAISVPRASGFQQPDKAELLKKARAAYYSLKTEGMTGFTCAMVPNWTALLQTQGVTDPATLTPAVEKLNQLHFSVTVDGNGAAKVTHNEISAENQKVAEGLKQIYSGMEQMTTGFFQTWSVFVVNPPLPEPDTEIELEKAAAEYRIRYNEGATKVGVNMGKDYAVSSVKATTADFDSVIRPHFAKSGKGFLMSSYEAQYEGTGGKDKTELQVALDYQDVSGMKLPQKLNLKGSYNGTPFQVEVAFSDCTASKQ